MGTDRGEDPSGPGELAPKTITDRFSDLERGDVVHVNGREMRYEVIETDTYSVVAESPSGTRVTFSQNLQSGGWVVHEDVRHVEAVEE